MILNFHLFHIKCFIYISTQAFGAGSEMGHRAIGAVMGGGGGGGNLILNLCYYFFFS